MHASRCQRCPADPNRAAVPRVAVPRLRRRVTSSQHDSMRLLAIISFLVAYCLTSLVAGYTSGGLYARSNGRYWIRTMLYTASLFPAVCFLVCMVLNFVGMVYGSLATVPLTSVLSVVLMWGVVALPLCVVGTILGRNWSGTPNHPCRVNTMPRAIPEKRWYAPPREPRAPRAFSPRSPPPRSPPPPHLISPRLSSSASPPPPRLSTTSPSTTSSPRLSLPSPLPPPLQVRAPSRAHRPGRHPALRLDLHRDVLRLHLLLELQVLLRVR